jgi:hypothetical protein
VAPKDPSRSAKAKARTKRSSDAQPVHSFQSLLTGLATITRNTIVPALPGAPGWDQDTEPTQLQKKILDLLGSRPSVASSTNFNIPATPLPMRLARLSGKTWLRLESFASRIGGEKLASTLCTKPSAPC